MSGPYDDEDLADPVLQSRSADVCETIECYANKGVSLRRRYCSVCVCTFVVCARGFELLLLPILLKLHEHDRPHDKHGPLTVAATGFLMSSQFQGSGAMDLRDSTHQLCFS